MNPQIKTITFSMPFHILEGRGGGAEVQAWLLSRELAKRGFDVHYVCQSITKGQKPDETLDGVKVKWVKHAHYFRWAKSFAYYRAITATNPDLVVERGSSFITGVAVFYCKRHGRKFAWICTDDTCAERWMTIRRKLKLYKHLAVNPFKRAVFLLDALIDDCIRQWGLARATYYFTQNEYQHNRLISVYGKDSRRMVTGHEEPAAHMRPADRLKGKIVLWVANFGPRKQPEKFVAMAMAAKEKNLSFVMIGDRPDKEYTTGIFRSAPANLEWLGKLSFDDALAWFDKAAFFINTSVADGEGFPNTFVQAWLRGVPVFSMGVDPNQVVTRNQLGFVGEQDALLEAIYSLSEDVDEYARLSRRVELYAKENHSISAMTDRFLDAL